MEFGSSQEINILKGRKLPPLPSNERLNEIILNNLRNNPDFVGQIDARTGETCTFKKLANDSIRCSLWLQKQGIGPDDIVAISSHHIIPIWIPFCATFFVGANLNIWYDQWSSEKSRYFAKLTKPKIIFANERAGRILKKVFEEEKIETKIIIFGKIAGFDSFDDILVNQGTFEEIENFRCYPVAENDNALLIFSSGSSGLPKGVQYSFSGLFYNLHKYSTSFTENEKMISTFTSPLYWISSQFNILRSLLHNYPLIIVDQPTSEDFCKAIEKHKIQWMLVGTAFLNKLFKSGLLDEHDFSSVEEIAAGGAKIRPEIMEKFNSILPNGEIIQGYGLTELGSLLCLQQRNEKIYDSCGKVTYGLELKIIELGTKNILRPNQKGEICAKQKHMMKYYFRNPEATKEAIDEDGWFHTGDLGFYDNEGNVFIVDRIKDLIKYKGHHISPLEIEKILSNHPEVLDVVVVPIPHPVDIEHTLAFVSTLKKSQELKKELFEMASVLGECKRLQKIVFLENLPLTGSGKFDRIKLKKMAKYYSD